MTNNQLRDLLNSLIETWETEVVEFKAARKGNKDNREIADYFSALANEVNLRNTSSAWLVFGVHNVTKSITGTSMLPTLEERNAFIHTIAGFVEPRIPFRNIFEVETEKGRVLLCEIPPAPSGMPIASNGKYYGREGESLKALSLDKLDEIRNQSLAFDWTAFTVDEATVDHLDRDALHRARKLFADKNKSRFSSEEVMAWTDIEFLNYAKLTRDGKITRATILLLGKENASQLLSPHPAQISWVLEGEERAYEHFGLPFLLSATHVYQRIRNVQIRILPFNQLIPVELAKYDQTIFLEALYNCIAHQDYSQSGRIVVKEYVDRLVFENVGGFFEGKPIEYVLEGRIPKRYRNPFLTQAMVNLNMIDTVGYGIRRMYEGQAKRYFPLPDYVSANPNSVQLQVFGSVVNLTYSQLLMQRLDLTLSDVINLDSVQKKHPLDAHAIQDLRRKKLIEGRKPNLHISSLVASAAEKKAEYIHFKGQDDKHYMELIRDYLKKYPRASRQDIDTLLLAKLSEVLTIEQKINKIHNLVSKMKKKGEIANQGNRRKPKWVLTQ